MHVAALSIGAVLAVILVMTAIVCVIDRRLWLRQWRRLLDT